MSAQIISCCWTFNKSSVPTNKKQYTSAKTLRLDGVTGKKKPGASSKWPFVIAVRSHNQCMLSLGRVYFRSVKRCRYWPSFVLASYERLSVRLWAILCAFSMQQHVILLPIQRHITLIDAVLRVSFRNQSSSA